MIARERERERGQRSGDERESDDILSSSDIQLREGDCRNQDAEGNRMLAVFGAVSGSWGEWKSDATAPH